MYGSPLDGFYPYGETVESLAGERIAALYFPIVDLSIPDADILNVFLTELEERLRNGERACMHCWDWTCRDCSMLPPSQSVQLHIPFVSDCLKICAAGFQQKNHWNASAVPI